MIQTLFCFSSARRRGQGDGWRWLPRRDKTARLSRHNRSITLLAQPRGDSHSGGVLECSCNPGSAVGADKHHDFCRVSSPSKNGTLGGAGMRCPPPSLGELLPFLISSRLQGLFIPFCITFAIISAHTSVLNVWGASGVWAGCCTRPLHQHHPGWVQTPRTHPPCPKPHHDGY